MKRKILSFALVLMMFLTMIIPAMTVMADFAGRSGPGEITINAPTNLSIDGQTFTLYQIFELKQYKDSKGNASYIYQTTPPFEDFRFTYNSIVYKLADFFKLPPSDVDYPNPISNIKVYLNAADEIALTTALKAYIESNPAGLNAYKETYTSTDPDQLVIDDLPLGYYMIFGGGKNAADPNGDGDEGNDQITSLCILTTTDPETEVTLKADAPELDKDVFNHTKNDWDKWTDVEIGDIVDFQLTATIPNLRGYTSYTYNVHDKMSAGLTFDPTSVVVEIDGEVFTDYTLVTTGLTDGCTFEIRFNGTAILRDYRNGANVVITYSAMLNGDAVIGAPGNLNDAQLEYSNDLYDNTSKGRTPWKRVKVYTFEIDVEKWYQDAVTGKTPLGGAEFELYRGEETTPIKLFKIDDNTYRLATSKDAVTTDSFVTPADGNIKIKGLDEGTYYLEEIKAPEGFNLLDTRIEVKVVHNAPKAGEYEIQYRTVPSSKTVVVEYLTGTISIENKGGIKFPETGGIGRTIFYIAGTILTLGAGVVLTVYWQTSAKKKEAAEAIR